MPAATAAAAPSALTGQMDTLRSRIAGLRRKFVVVTLTHGGLVVGGAAAAIVAGEMGLDWLVESPWLVRLLIFLGGAGTVAWLARQRLVLPWRRRPDEDAVALMIERALPVFQGRYICSVQLARNPAAVEASSAPGLIRALVAQTAALAADLRYGPVVSTRQLRRALWRAALGAAVGIGGFVLVGASGGVLLRRAFLSTEEVPAKTHVVGVTGNRVVATGGDLLIEARATGVVPTRPGRLVMTAAATHDPGEFPFEAVAGKPGQFARLVASVQGPFDYQVRLGDGHSARFHVTTRPRPALTSLEAVQVYPAYTRLPPVRRSLNDLSLLAGSRLRLRCRASVDVQAGSVRLFGASPPAPVPLHLVNARELTAELPIDASAAVTGFSVSLVDPAGIETRDPTVYRIDALADQPPAVRITYPVRAEELVTARARLLLAFEATDDLGIARLTLRYQLSPGGDGATVLPTVEKSLEMDLGSDRPRSLRRRYEWNIADLKPAPAPGTIIEYWLEAADANDVTGPGIGRTEHYTARVVTDQEKLADLMNRTADMLNGVGEAAGQEEELTRQLGGIITSKATQPPP